MAMSKMYTTDGKVRWFANEEDVNTKLISMVNVPPHHLSFDERISEATLCFYKNFWEQQPFNNNSELIVGPTNSDLLNSTTLSLIKFLTLLITALKIPFASTPG